MSETKKKIHLDWFGDGPDSWSPGQSIVVEIDPGELLDDEDMGLDRLESCLRRFASDLKDEFDADAALTDGMIEERNALEKKDFEAWEKENFPPIPPSPAKGEGKP